METGGDKISVALRTVYSERRSERERESESESDS